MIGSIVAFLFSGPLAAAVVGSTLVLVSVCGTFFGSSLPLAFRHFGLDPAMMSNPFVAVLIDIVGIAVYLAVAQAMLAIL